MKLPIAEPVVEWDLIWQVIWSAAAAGLGVTIAMSFAILGASRAADAQRNGDTAKAVLYSGIFVLGFAACAAAVVLGIIVMTTKD